MKTKILLKSLLVLIVSIFCSVNVMGQGDWDLDDLGWDTPFQPMNIVVTNATLDDLVLETGDQIGVFTEDAGLVGFTTITDANFTDPLTIVVSMIDGNNGGATPGDSLFFKYNVVGAVALYENIEATYSSGSYSALAWGTSVVSLSTVTYVTQTIELAEGKNLVTIKVVAEDDNVSSVFAGVSNLVKVESQGGLYQYIPTTHWVNTLGTDDDGDEEGNLTYDVGYWIETSAAGTLVINGSAYTPVVFTIEKGWNILPYYGTDEEGVLASTVLNSMEVGGVAGDWLLGTIVQSESGEEIEYDGVNWIGDDADTFKMFPNKAYLIYTSAEKIVEY